MKRLLKYGIGIIAVLLLAYKSVYVKKLSDVKASSSTFDAKAYARNYLYNKLIPSLNSALDINELIALLENDKYQAFKEYSNALGIGNIRYFLVKGEGNIISVNENDVLISANADSNQINLRIATEFVFGNAIRDASGKIDINEFSNTMDFNNVSAEINKLVRAEILPEFKAHVRKGDRIQFAGAVELNEEHFNMNDIEVVPIQLKIINSK